ncbi:hypothetical protein C0J52_13877 [Blattella germanica]|nr:hypothetical protein C0J52_13877 [Blattella germanica]
MKHSKCDMDSSVRMKFEKMDYEDAVLLKFKRRINLIIGGLLTYKIFSFKTECGLRHFTSMLFGILYHRISV